MNNLKIVILEDEPLAVQRLEQLIKQEIPQAEIIQVFDNSKDAKKYFSTNPEIDLIFSDIQLADGESFDALIELKKWVPIIFITAYNEHALRAFEWNSIMYLLKPLKQDDFKKAVQKYNQIKGNQELVFGLEPTFKAIKSGKIGERILVKYGSKLKVISLDEIAYFYTENRGVWAVLFHGEKYPVDFNLDELEKGLDTEKFFRLNRQFISSIKSIKEMNIYHKGRLKIILNPPYNEDIIISAERSAEFKNWLIKA